MFNLLIFQIALYTEDNLKIRDVAGVERVLWAKHHPNNWHKKYMLKDTLMGM